MYDLNDIDEKVKSITSIYDDIEKINSKHNLNIKIDYSSYNRMMKLYNNIKMKSSLLSLLNDFLEYKLKYKDER